MKKRKKTWLEVIVQRVGLRAAYRVMDFTVSWSIVAASLEREPTMVEYLEWWRGGLSQATAYRQWETFRRAFEAEGFETPGDLLRAAGVTWGAQGAAIWAAPAS